MDATGGLRERRALRAAGLVGGPIEVVDLVLPLWAGAAIGLSAAEVGVLVAVVVAAALVVRPVARVLADRWERRHTAAVGALLHALACVGYAVAENAPVAYGAAAVGGAGGALVWAAVRAIVGERQADDSAASLRVGFARDVGALSLAIPGLALFAVVGFAGLFWACAALCVVAAAVLVAAPRRDEGDDDLGATAVPRAVGRPSTASVATTVVTAAETAVGLLLVLHLQRGFDLDVLQVLLVFLPGTLVMGVAAMDPDRPVRRFGRGRVSAVATAVGCATALSFAWAPNPYVIAALWVLNGAAWGAVMKVRQAVVVEAARRANRPVGMHDTAGLVGLLIGSLAAGFLYDGVQWWTACAAAAVMVAVGAVLLWLASRRLGVPEVPVVKA